MCFMVVLTNLQYHFFAFSTAVVLCLGFMRIVYWLILDGPVISVLEGFLLSNLIVGVVVLRVIVVPTTPVYYL